MLLVIWYAYQLYTHEAIPKSPNSAIVATHKLSAGNVQVRVVVLTGLPMMVGCDPSAVVAHQEYTSPMRQSAPSCPIVSSMSRA